MPALVIPHPCVFSDDLLGPWSARGELEEAGDAEGEVEDDLLEDEEGEEAVRGLARLAAERDGQHDLHRRQRLQGEKDVQ